MQERSYIPIVAVILYAIGLYVGPKMMEVRAGRVNRGVSWSIGAPEK